MKRLLCLGLCIGVVALLGGCAASIGFDTDNNNNNGGGGDPGLEAVVLTQVPYTRATITWPEPAGTTGYELRIVEGAGTWDQAAPAETQPSVCGAGQACEFTVPGLQLKIYRAFLRYKVGSNRSAVASIDIDANFKLARYLGDDDGLFLGTSIALGDLDRDGVQDLAVAGSGQTPARAFIFQGGRNFLSRGPASSHGILVPMADIRQTDLGFPSVQIGDLTCDGHDDLLVNTSIDFMRVSRDSVSWQGRVSLGTENFFDIRGPDLTMFVPPHQPAIADLLGNGCPDMVMGGQVWPDPDLFGELDVLTGGVDADIIDFGPHYSDPAWQGNGFGQKLGYYVYNVGDVDGNGRDELIFSDVYNVPGGPSKNVSLKFFAHDGANYITMPVDLPMLSVFLYEFREDRTMDIGGNEVGVFAGPLGDLNGDGVNDFYVTSLIIDGADRGGQVYIFLGKAGDLNARVPDFSLRSTDSTTFGAGVAKGDYDNDGVVELLIGSAERIYVYRYSEDTGNYEFATTIAYPCAMIQVTDFNQDQYLDLMCGNPLYGFDGGALAIGAMDFRY